MTDLLIEKKNNETVAYVVDRFLRAGIEYNQLFAITRTMKSEFGVSSEDEAEKLVKKYLTSLDQQ